MLKLKQLFKLALTGLISIISQRKCLPVLWSIALLTAGLSFSSWPLAAFMPEALKKIDIVYYIYFPWYKKYKTEKIKGCHGFFLHSGSAVLRCEENVSLLRPLHTIKAWRRQQCKMGFLSLTMDEFGIKKVHGYIKKIQSISFDTFSIHKKNGKERPVIGKFIRHVNDVRKYRFKNRTTGKISTVFSTPNHPFYVKNKGMFIPIETISSEDEMMQKDGQIVHIICSLPHGTHCGVDSRESIVPVYNLEILRKHTYFVGQGGILVHNPCVSKPRKNKRNISVVDRYRLFAENGYITRITDPDNGHITLEFRLKAEDRDRFILQCGGSESKSETDKLNVAINQPLRKLGFVSQYDHIALSGKKRELIWILKNHSKFKQKIPSIDDYLPALRPSYTHAFNFPISSCRQAPLPPPLLLPPSLSLPLPLPLPLLPPPLLPPPLLPPALLPPALLPPPLLLSLPSTALPFP